MGEEATQEDSAGVGGPFTLLTRRGGEQVAYLEVQGAASS